MKYLGGKFDSLSSIVIYNHAKYLLINRYFTNSPSALNQGCIGEAYRWE